LPSTFTRILDFVHELNGLGGINQKVSSNILWSERPKFNTSVFSVPAEFFSEFLGSFLGIILGSNLVIFNSLGEIFLEGFSLGIDSVMFVGGFGHTDLVRFFSNGFSVRDDGVRFNDGALSIIFFKILETDFDMEFSASGNNVFTVIITGDDDQRIRLGQFLESFNQSGEVLSILGLDGNSDDW
jgi:hypothetical protein